MDRRRWLTQTVTGGLAAVLPTRGPHEGLSGLDGSRQGSDVEDAGALDEALAGVYEAVERAADSAGGLYVHQKCFLVSLLFAGLCEDHGLRLAGEYTPEGHGFVLAAADAHRIETLLREPNEPDDRPPQENHDSLLAAATWAARRWQEDGARTAGEMLLALMDPAARAKAEWVEGGLTQADLVPKGWAPWPFYLLFRRRRR